MRDATDLELAYFAGFFDGEGCIGIQRCRKKRRSGVYTTYEPYATVSQRLPEVLRQMQDAFGGNVYWNASGGPNGIWALQWSNRAALDFVTRICPHLRGKRAQAECLLEAYAVKVVNRKAGIPADILARREQAYATLRVLKRG